MKAQPVTVRHLLENRQRFCVPIYQRRYVWTRDKQWEPFWNDIRTQAVERLNGRSNRFPHYMGAVVLESRGSSSSKQVTSFQIVDGQQRLTTFQLFLSAARDYSIQAGFEETAELIESYLFNEKQHLMENPEVEKYKVWPTHERELFQDILTLERKDLRSKYQQFFYKTRDKIYPYRTTPNLLGAYGYFFDKIKQAIETDDLESDMAEFEDVLGQNDSASESESESKKQLDSEKCLYAIWESLIEEFKIVEIMLEENDDAQVIFETLNERGEPLLAADLIRNNIFQRADANQEQAEALFAKYWKEFEDPFWGILDKQGRYRKERIEFFLANFISAKTASEITFSKLFSEYKAFTRQKTSGKSRGYESVEEELSDLAEYGRIYKRLLQPSDSDPLGIFAMKLDPWDVTTVYPLVLRLWVTNELAEDGKVACLSILLSFIVRRTICSLTSKNYNKFFLSVLRHLESKGFCPTRLSEFLIAQKSESSRFPNNQEFKHAWISEPVYVRLKSPRVAAVLEAIERKKRTRFQESEHLRPYLTVEHVMPTDWENHWPLPDNDEKPTYWEMFQASYADEDTSTRVGQIVRRNRLKDTFGNLTILTRPLNSSVSNGPFEKKRKALKKKSLLMINREIVEEDDWTEETIERRGQSLFHVALELWNFPLTKDC